MKCPRPVTVDFETLPIGPRPHYPPRPVGVAIQWPGQRRARYFAWGHPAQNNATEAEAVAELRRAWEHPDGILCHNGKFDLDVAEVHLGLPMPEWERCHDTLFLAYLDDPRQRELGLKPLAMRLLGMPPDERDAVADWLVQHQPVPGVRITAKRAGAYIAHAPGDVVAPYAAGDAERTTLLFKHLWAGAKRRRMLGAYDRERRVQPVLLASERHGVRIDHLRLSEHVDHYGEIEKKLTHWVCDRLGAPLLNPDSAEELVAALIAADAADMEALGKTAKGRVSTSKAALARGVRDPQLAAVLSYRSQLQTCLQTFMRPWLATANQSGGVIFTNWHQVRGAEGKGGTRTGRLSSSPNFQNIPKEFAPLFAHEQEGLPDAPFSLPSLPLCRSYIVPMAPDHVLIDRDYNQAEIRVLAHYEDGTLLSAYQENPWMDVHDTAQEMINKRLKRDFSRKHIKNTGFGLIYGMGIAKLAATSNCSLEDARDVRNEYLAVFPELKELYDDMKIRSREKESVRTWGGREFFCEEPIIVDGRKVELDYKQINTLVQGSAADCAKEAVARIGSCLKPGWFFYMQVHDQITLSVPLQDAIVAMETLRNVMESVELDVPMLSEGSVSFTNWSELQDYDKKGSICQPNPLESPPGRFRATTTTKPARAARTTSMCRSARSREAPPWTEAPPSTRKRPITSRAS